MTLCLPGGVLIEKFRVNFVDGIEAFEALKIHNASNRTGGSACVLVRGFIHDDTTGWRISVYPAYEINRAAKHCDLFSVRRTDSSNYALSCCQTDASWKG